MDPASSPTIIRYKFGPYSYLKARDLFHKVEQEFGPKGQRWQYVAIGNPNSIEANTWELDFSFCDPVDAIIFTLKFQT